MRTLRIERDLTITEIDVDRAEWRGDADWDAARVDAGHYAWTKDDALFQPGLVVANVGEARRIALPAYVLGVDASGKTVPATIAIDALKALVT